MKIIVLGAQGQVGWELVRALQVLGDVVAADQNTCDFLDTQGLKDWVSLQQPDVIVNAAAYTGVDKAEKDEANAMQINATAVAALAAVAHERGALLVHYSTDYVFDGTSSRPYLESDPPCPLNVYGRSKLAGDEAILKQGCDHLIFRTTWVYASRGANFVLTMLRLAREREMLRIVSDQIGAPTWARNIADATAQAIAHAQRERADGTFNSGLFNLASQGEASWHDFARAIFEQAREKGLEEVFVLKSLEPIPSSAYPLPAARPLNSRLDTHKLQVRFGLVLPTWQTALACCLDEIKEKV